LTDLNVVAHVFDDYDLYFSLTFAVLELWLIQLQIDCLQFFLYNQVLDIWWWTIPNVRVTFNFGGTPSYLWSGWSEKFQIWCADWSWWI